MTDWRLKLGVSLHCLDSPCAPSDVGLLAESAVETLELSANLFDGPAGSTLRDALKRVFATSRVRAASVHALFGGSRDISVLDDAARAAAVRETLTAVDTAADLDARFVVVHGSAEPIEDHERAARIDQCRRSLAEIGEAVQGRRVGIVVELLPRTCLGNTVDELRQLIDGLDEEMFGVCLDTNHAMDRWREVPSYANALGDRLWALHISDYDGVDEKHQMPGEGVVEWGPFAAALRDMGYDGPFNYEARPAGACFAERLRSLEENFQWVCEQV